MGKSRKTNKKSGGKPKPRVKGNEATFAQNARQFWNEKRPILLFLIGFTVGMAVFYLFYNSVLYKNTIASTIENTQAIIASGILSVLGHTTTVDGDLIQGQEFAVSISDGCDGLEPLAMLVIGILVFPLAFRWKWQGMLAGLIVLFILNLIRIAGLYLAGVYIPSAFEFLHLHGGFILFTIISIGLWMVWVNWAMRQQNAAHVSN